MKKLFLLGSLALILPVFGDVNVEKEEETTTAGYMCNKENETPRTNREEKTPLNPKHICDQPKKPPFEE